MTRQFTVCIPKDVGEWLDALEHLEQVVQEALQAYLKDVYRCPTEEYQRLKLRRDVVMSHAVLMDKVKRTVEVPNDLLGWVEEAARLHDPLASSTDLAAEQIITVALLACYNMGK